VWQADVESQAIKVGYCHSLPFVQIADLASSEHIELAKQKPSQVKRYRYDPQMVLTGSSQNSRN